MPKAIARRRAGLEHELELDGHRVTVDEPEDKGGTDNGAAPTELLAGALAGCTSITLLMYADRKSWELGDLEVEVSFETPGPGEDQTAISCAIRIPEPLEPDQVERLKKIATKCPVHRVLAGTARIDDEITAG